MAMRSTSLIEAEDNRQVVAHWFAEYQGPLFRYLVRLVDDHERAADLLQDTFLRAFTALKSQPLPDNAFAWLHRIATNLAYTAIRRANRWRWLPLSGHERAPSFENNVATAQSVRRCLARLNSREAEALLLFEVAGLSCVEIAALAGEQPNAVRVRLHRARSRFCTLYERESVHGMS